MLIFCPNSNKNQNAFGLSTILALMCPGANQGLRKVPHQDSPQKPCCVSRNVSDVCKNFICCAVTLWLPGLILPRRRGVPRHAGLRSGQNIEIVFEFLPLDFYQEMDQYGFANYLLIVELRLLPKLAPSVRVHLLAVQRRGARSCLDGKNSGHVERDTPHLCECWFSCFRTYQVYSSSRIHFMPYSLYVSMYATDPV